MKIGNNESVFRDIFSDGDERLGPSLRSQAGAAPEDRRAFFPSFPTFPTGDGQTSEKEAWSQTLEVALRYLCIVVLGMAILGGVLDLIRWFSLGSVEGAPLFSSVGPLAFTVSLTVIGALAFVFAIWVTRPRNAAVTAVIYGGGFLMSALAFSVGVLSLPGSLDVSRQNDQGELEVVFQVSLKPASHSFLEQGGANWEQYLEFRLVDAIPILIASVVSLVIFYLVSKMIIQLGKVKSDQ